MKKKKKVEKSTDLLPAMPMDPIPHKPEALQFYSTFPNIPLRYGN